MNWGRAPSFSVYIFLHMRMTRFNPPGQTFKSSAVRQLKELVSKQTRKKGAPETESGSCDKSPTQKSQKSQKLEREKIKREPDQLVVPTMESFAKQS